MIDIPRHNLITSVGNGIPQSNGSSAAAPYFGGYNVDPTVYNHTVHIEFDGITDNTGNSSWHTFDVNFVQTGVWGGAYFPIVEANQWHHYSGDYFVPDYTGKQGWMTGLPNDLYLNAPGTGAIANLQITYAGGDNCPQYDGWHHDVPLAPVSDAKALKNGNMVTSHVYRGWDCPDIAEKENHVIFNTGDQVFDANTNGGNEASNLQFNVNPFIYGKNVTVKFDIKLDSLLPGGDSPWRKIAFPKMPAGQNSFDIKLDPTNTTDWQSMNIQAQVDGFDVNNNWYGMHNKDLTFSIAGGSDNCEYHVKNIQISINEFDYMDTLFMVWNKDFSGYLEMYIQSLDGSSFGIQETGDNSDPDDIPELNVLCSMPFDDKPIKDTGSAMVQFQFMPLFSTGNSYLNRWSDYNFDTNQKKVGFDSFNGYICQVKDNDEFTFYKINEVINNVWHTLYATQISQHWDANEKDKIVKTVDFLYPYLIWCSGDMYYGINVVSDSMIFAEKAPVGYLLNGVSFKDQNNLYLSLVDENDRTVSRVDSVPLIQRNNRQEGGDDNANQSNRLQLNYERGQSILGKPHSIPKPANQEP